MKGMSSFKLELTSKPPLILVLLRWQLTKLCIDQPAAILYSRQQEIETFSHGWVRENGISYCRVRQFSEHGHLNHGHHFSGGMAEQRATQNAIAVLVDDGLK